MWTTFYEQLYCYSFYRSFSRFLSVLSMIIQNVVVLHIFGFCISLEKTVDCHFLWFCSLTFNFIPNNFVRHLTLFYEFWSWTRSIRVSYSHRSTDVFISKMSAIRICITFGMTYYALHEWTQSKYLCYICLTWMWQLRRITGMPIAIIVCFDAFSIDILVPLFSDEKHGENQSRVLSTKAFYT